MSKFIEPLSVNDLIKIYGIKRKDLKNRVLVRVVKAKLLMICDKL